MLNQFSPDYRARLHAQLRDIAQRREVVLLGMEYNTGETPTLTLARYGRQANGTPITLACCESHGRWIEWTYK